MYTCTDALSTSISLFFFCWWRCEECVADCCTLTSGTNRKAHEREQQIPLYTRKSDSSCQKVCACRSKSGHMPEAQKGFRHPPLNLPPTMSSFTIAPSLAKFNVALTALENSGDNVGKRLVIGVAIVRRSERPGGLPKVLLVQRASHEQLFPDMYELPGGKCEPADSSLLDTVARETLEETGYRVTQVLGEFPGFEYSTPKYEARQYNFIVAVDGGSDVDPTLDPNEHQAFAWADESDYKAYPMSEAMQAVVTNALSSTLR